MNKVYIILREEDWYYDDKYTYIDVFDTKESAKKYFEVYLETLLKGLEENHYGDDFYDSIEITEYKKNENVQLYMDDSYWISLTIEEHDVMNMN